MNNFPCRVAIDLANHEADLRDHEPESFDEWNDMHVRAVVPYELVKPVQDLLLWKNVDDLPEEMRKDLKALYKACVERWRDI